MKKLLLLLVLLLTVVVFALPPLLSVETQDLAELRPVASPYEGGGFASTGLGVTHYQDIGPRDGAVVVLVHGFASPMCVWDKTAPALAAAGYRVIRFDLMGRGLSARPDPYSTGASYDTSYFSQQIMGLLEHLEVEGAINIVGYSMGGAVVGQFANQHPGRVARQALIAPFNTAKSVGPLAWPLVGDWLAQVVLAPRMPGRQASNFYQPEKFPQAGEQFRQQMVYRGFTKAIHASLKTIITQDHIAAYENLAQFKKPTLLIWGTEDQVLPFAEHQRVRAVLGAHQFLSLEATGHAPALEQPQQVNTALLRWLADGQI